MLDILVDHGKDKRVGNELNHVAWTRWQGNQHAWWQQVEENRSSEQIHIRHFITRIGKSLELHEARPIRSSFVGALFIDKSLPGKNRRRASAVAGNTLIGSRDTSYTWTPNKRTRARIAGRLTCHVEDYECNHCYDEVSAPLWKLHLYVTWVSSSDRCYNRASLRQLEGQSTDTWRRLQTQVRRARQSFIFPKQNVPRK